MYKKIVLAMFSLVLSNSNLTAGMVSVDGQKSCTVFRGGLTCQGKSEIAWVPGESSINNLNTYRDPVEIFPVGSGIEGVFVSKEYTCIVINGGMKCWGYIGQNSFEDNPNVRNHIHLKTIFKENSGVTDIEGNAGYVCAIVNEGLFCLGKSYQSPRYNSGKYVVNTLNSDGDSLKPVQVYKERSGISGASLTWNRICVVNGGGLSCVGRDVQFNNLGEYSRSPVQVIAINRKITRVSAAEGHFCLIVRGGVCCGGSDENGQLGSREKSWKFGSFLMEVFPEESGVTQLAASKYYTCAVKDNGLWCWGWNVGLAIFKDRGPSIRNPVEILPPKGGVWNIEIDSDLACFSIYDQHFCLERDENESGPEEAIDYISLTASDRKSHHIPKREKQRRLDGELLLSELQIAYQDMLYVQSHAEENQFRAFKNAFVAWEDRRITPTSESLSKVSDGEDGSALLAGQLSEKAALEVKAIREKFEEAQAYFGIENTSLVISKILADELKRNRDGWQIFQKKKAAQLKIKAIMN